MVADVDTGKAQAGGTFQQTEEFKGRAALVSLSSLEVQPLLSFTGVTYNVGDRVKFARDVKGPFMPAMASLADQLRTQFPGTSTPAAWAPLAEPR